MVSIFRSQSPARMMFWAAFAPLFTVFLSEWVIAQETDGLTAALALEQTLTRIVEQVEPSVVSIARIHKSPAKPRLNRFNIEAFDPPVRDDPRNPDFVPNEFGAGFVISPADNSEQRLILTNYHVVRGGPVDGQPVEPDGMELYVQFWNRRGCYARILAADPRSDLATLIFSPKDLGMTPAELKPLKLGNGADLRKGQLVLTFGNPYAIARDGSVSVSWGMISNLTRQPARLGSASDREGRSGETIHHYGTLLQIDSRLNLGTSGGPVTNLRGEAIGICTSLAALEGYEKSAGFAVPFDKGIQRIVDALAHGHEAEYGFLGVQPTSAVLPNELQEVTELAHPSWVKVFKVSPGTPADGRIHDNDVVLAINGEPIYAPNDLMRVVGQLGPETHAQVTLWRQGRELTVPVKLGKWPVKDEEGIIATRPRFAAWRGLSVDYPTGRYRLLPDPIRGYPAVVVVNLEPGSPAERAGLRVGDYILQVNRKPVQTPAEFHAAVRNQRGNVTLTLLGDRQITISE